MAKKVKTEEQMKLEKFQNVLDGYKHKNDMVLIVRMMNTLKIEGYDKFFDECIKNISDDVKTKIKTEKDASV